MPEHTPDDDAPSTISAAQRLRSSALWHYASHGPEGVGVREITADAGVATGLIRHHFGSKAGLTRAVDDHVLEAVAQALAAVPVAGTAADITAAREAAFARLLQERPEIAGYLRWCLVVPGRAPDDDGLIERLIDLTAVETEALRGAGLGGGRDLRTSVLTTLLRQIGSLMVQPLADRIWTRVAAEDSGRSVQEAPIDAQDSPAPRVEVVLATEPSVPAEPSEPAETSDQEPA